jgi:hypothetical protein
MDRVILKNSADIDTKENDTKKNKKRMKQPFKMERDYNGDIQNTDNADIQQYHDHWRMMDTTPRVGKRDKKKIIWVKG